MSVLEGRHSIATRMAQATVPHIGGGGESEVGSMGDGVAARSEGVEIAITVAAKEYGPGTQILDRKTKRVEFK